MKKERKSKSAGEHRGRFKMVIYFKEHRLARGFTMYSTVGQDKRGISLTRFKNLVLQGKFAGRVKWAGIYERGVRVWKLQEVR